MGKGQCDLPPYPYLNIGVRHPKKKSLLDDKASPWATPIIQPRVSGTPSQPRGIIYSALSVALIVSEQIATRLMPSQREMRKSDNAIYRALVFCNNPYTLLVHR